MGFFPLEAKRRILLLGNPSIFRGRCYLLGFREGNHTPEAIGFCKKNHTFLRRWTPETPSVWGSMFFVWRGGTSQVRIDNKMFMSEKNWWRTGANMKYIWSLITENNMISASYRLSLETLNIDVSTFDGGKKWIDSLTGWWVQFSS